MKKLMCLLLALVLLTGLCACGGKTGGEENVPANTEWTRQGFFQDEQGNMISVTLMEDVVDPGWYVACMLGEDLIDDSYGGMLPQEGNTLHGTLPSGGDKAALTVTVSEEGDGLLLAVEGGESYHFTPVEMPEAQISVSINTEGWGNIANAEGDQTPEIDPEYPYQSTQINLAEPTTYTFLAWPMAGNRFVKWTKDGLDFSDDPQITVLLDESAEFIAVFEDDPDWQNPVMNFIGEYQSGRAHALVECLGKEEALITIEWGGSAWEMARWMIIGPFDENTMTINYAGCLKEIVVYDENGEIKSEEPEYEDGTGTVVFGEGLSFTWHEDGADREDMVFEWLPVAPEDSDYYSAVTSMDKSDVEELCVILRSAYLDEDWETISVYLRYPITINGTELKDASAFLSYMQDKTVAESDREAMRDENCHDMFHNGQGICFGAGELWLVDLSYMTEAAPEFVIIGINGIVSK